MLHTRGHQLGCLQGQASKGAWIRQQETWASVVANQSTHAHFKLFKDDFLNDTVLTKQTFLSCLMVSQL